VRTFSQVLLEKGLLQGKDLHHLERIKAAGDNMNDLIAALLDLARFGRARIEPAVVDLSELAFEAADECRDATGRQLEVVVEGGCRVLGDAGLLRVVMCNLLANAWKFTRDAAAPRVEIVFEPHGDVCMVTVRDNGAGFDEAYASRLFQPFQRLHGTREFPGLGIGLATVHRIVQRHGGRIWASGQVGQGAAFHFTLPLAVEALALRA
jgi:signal transduction histidine kinase